MNFQDILPEELESTSLAPRLKALHELYARVDEATSRFQVAARAHVERQGRGFGCPGGCGSCCERFVPDILPVEADYAALFIMRHRPELAATKPQANPPCPYYDPDRPEAHCRIYEARPLICRSFGWAAVADKDGRPSFSLCWKMEGLPGTEKRSWSGAELLEVLGAEPPVMADFGLALEAIAGPAPLPKPLIAEAIGDSLRRLDYLVSLARQAS